MPAATDTLGLLLSTGPGHPNLDTAIGLAEAALTRGTGLYLYLIDEGVRALDDPRIGALPGRGARLFVCAYGCQKRRIPLDAAWSDLPARERQFLLHNEGGRYLGMFPFLERLEEKRYKQYIRVFLRQYQLAKTCPGCGGARLKPESLAVRVAGKTIAEAAALTATDLADWLDQLRLPSFQQIVADHILAELRARIGFVNDVGLGYLTLDRQTRTLSGGEAQRIALSNALGSHLVDTLYVLDEPSIGLHQRDNRRLIETLVGLRDLGNTILVDEHDEETIRSADHVIDFGPGAGVRGSNENGDGVAGSVVAEGEAESLLHGKEFETEHIFAEKLNSSVEDLFR